MGHDDPRHTGRHSDMPDQLAAGARTLFDRIWDQHVLDVDADGKALLYVDRAVVDDVRAPHVLASLERRGLRIRRPELALVVQDHSAPSFPTHGALGGSSFIDATRVAAQQWGLRLLDIGDPAQGISHVAAPESGFVPPGATYVCVDSHAPTVGGLGALGFGCGSTEIEHVLATQTIWLRKPRQMRIRLDGALETGVCAKDIILRLAAELGPAARGLAIEFYGDAIADLGVEARMTLCNMAVELGARTALVAPDSRTMKWLAQRGLPAYGLGALMSDTHAAVDAHATFDCADLEPQITWGSTPAQSMSVTGVAPAGGVDNARALAYMGLRPGDELRGMKIDHVFIGSCTNGRYDDLASAARVLTGRRVADGVRAVVVPGSRAVTREAETRGLREVFLAAGFLWGEPGCSMCAGGGGETIQPGARVVSTANRNFENRQGPGVRTHLASPMTAAAAAVMGVIADPRPLLVTGGAP